jgi:serine/threonine protein kinase
MDRDPFDLTGDVLDGQFRVDSFAGEGDLSVVYKGHHLGVDAPVAIKCLNLPATLDPDLVRPLVDGFKEASRVHYKLARGNLNIAQSIASGTTLVPRSGAVVPYMVREWFDGESLSSNLTRRRGEGSKGRTVKETLALLETAFDGVAFAHQQGEVHLSINPSNLFLAARGDSTTLKVLDFGIARTMNALMTEVPSGAHPEGGLRVLFPSYAAPEQLDRSVGKPGPWTDVYALALVTMEVLSDRLVMAEQETGALVEHALDPKRRPSPTAHGLKLPRNLEHVLTRAVARTPAGRQLSAGALWRDMQSAVRPVVSRSMPAVRGASEPMEAEIPVEVSRPPPPPVVESSIDRAIESAFESLSPSALVSKPFPAPSIAPLIAPSIAAPIAAPTPPTIAPVIAPPSAMARPKTLMGMGAAGAAEPPASPPVAEAGPEPVFAPASMLSAFDDTQLSESRGLPVLARRLAASLATRVERLREEPRARLLMVGGSLAGAVLLVTLVASLWRHCGTPIPPPTAAASSAAPVAVPPPEPEPAPQPTPAPAPTRPFNAYAARRALDATSGNVLSCRRDKKWGVALATVTFGNDGAVSQVAVGVPFRGTPAGECVAEDLSAARIPPFAGKEGVVLYRFFIALK